MLMKRLFAHSGICALLALGLSHTVFAQAKKESPNPLATKTSNTVGVTVSGYQYLEPNIEPGVDVSLKATMVGIDYSGIYAFAQGWYARGDLHYAYGPAKYSGSGTQSNIPYYYGEARGLSGYDFNFSALGGFVLAPYMGLGYRYLFDNQGGQTSTGQYAYQRSSSYFYVPIGVTHRMMVNDTHRIETAIEYDYLIQGKQMTKLSQASSYLPNITNQQNQGYGLRFSSMYQFEKWSVGPFVTYWNIGQSNTYNGTINAGRRTASFSAYEPANNTIEAGLKVAYSF